MTEENLKNEDLTGAIAIVGMAGRFPGAKTLAQFWQNLAHGVESITRLQDEDLDAEDPLRGQANYVKARSVLEDVDLFDAEFWGMYPKEAALTDPQQRIFLECAWEALEDAGYDPQSYPGAIAVFAGASLNTYLIHNLCSDPDRAQDLVRNFPSGAGGTMMGNLSDFLATRVSYKLNLRGPAFTVQSACSTSLVAVCQACQSLLTYQADMALAGGVSISFPQNRGYLHTTEGIVSPDGHCRSFDASAQGTIFGSGSGVVLLKRLPEALDDGDHIYAVIKGFALNNDGSAKVGYAAPSVEGQAAVIALAQAVAGVEPESITYLEAHGTATPLGDPIEIAAATKAFRAGTDAKGFCALGTAKTNIGHLDVAAGVTGLIKTVLSLQKKQIPPVLHFQQANPKLDLANTPFYVNTKLTEWRRTATPRRAGVSSFGFGGTNAHVVLEEAPAPGPSSCNDEAQLLLLSAKTASALSAAAVNLAEHLKSEASPNLCDVAYTLQVGRRSFPQRRFVVASSKEEAVRALEGSDKNSTGTAAQERPPVVFLFPGQGSQYCGMGSDLYRSEPEFTQWIDRCCDLFQPLLEHDLRAVIYPQGGDAPQAEQLLTSTAFAQPALFAVEFALAKLWMSWGVQPDAMIGHSIGEFAAACLSGVFSLEDAVRLVAARGRLMQAQPSGIMLAVRLPEAELTLRMHGQLAIAAINAPGMCVVSGPAGEVESLERSLSGQGVAARVLHTSHAFHSAMMDPAVAPFVETVRQAKLSPGTIPYLSGVSGDWAKPEEVTDPAYWGRHLRQPVRFADGVQSLSALGNALLLEVGPGKTLTTLAQQHPARKPEQTLISSLPDVSRSLSDRQAMLRAAGRLWTRGVLPDWPAIHRQEPRRRVSLPTYPFERKRFWIEAKSRVPATLPGLSAGLPLPADTPAASVDSIFAEAAVQPEFSSAPPSPAREKVVAVLSEMSGIAPQDIDGDSTFIELGFDSLFLTQFTHAVHSQLGVRITLRQLLEEQSSVNALAQYLELHLPSAAVAVPSVPPQSITTSAAGRSLSAVSAAAAPALVEAMMKEQLRTMLELMSRQMEALRSLGARVPTDNAERLLSSIQKSVAGFEAAEASQTAPGLAVELAAVRPALFAGPVSEAPFTDAQMELLLAVQMNEELSCAFNEGTTVELEGPLHLEALQAAIRQLTTRHDALRMTVSPDGERQRFHPHAEAEVSLIDLTALDEERRWAGLDRIKQTEAKTPFDLAKGPLVRWKIVRLQPDRHALLFTAQHLVCDGWSTDVLLEELARLYSANRAQQPAQLPPAPSFGRYAIWQQEHSRSREVEACEKYWTEQFAQALADLDLPTDRPRLPVRSYKGSTYTTRIGREALAKIKAVSAQHDCTLFVTLLSAFEVLLSRLGQQEDIVVGVPTAGQFLLEQPALVGHCVNFLPLRAQVADDMTFSALLAQQRRRLLDAHEHTALTYGTLLRKLSLGRTPDRLPLTEVRFNLQRESPRLPFGEVQARMVPDPKAFVNFPLVLNVAESDGGLDLHCDFNTDLWEEASIARWLKHYQSLLASVVADAEQSVGSLSLLEEEQKRTMVVAWNATATDYPRSRGVHQLFELQAERVPDAVAAVFEDQHYDYSELNQRANRLARHLIKIGAGQGSIVGIYMDRSLEMMVGLLGILKSGAAYLPLDPSYPKERINFIIGEASVPVLLTQSHLALDIPRTAARIVCLDGDWDLIAGEGGTNLNAAVRPDDLAYVIYTSGSTGKPKGVEIPHQAVVNLLCSMAATPGMQEGDTMLAVTTLSFDIAALELFLPLVVGAKVIIASRAVAADPVELMVRMESCGATIMQATPVTWRMLIEAGWTGRPLRKILCGGEALPRDLADRMLTLGPEIWNMYGPTETTIWSSTCLVPAGKGRVPIGPPIANTRFYVLDRHQQPVPIGVPGELFIGGDGVAQGYHRRPDLTQERFLEDPFHPGERMYRTGDLALYRSDGTIDFLGRVDHQIKLRGFRIELGEIETALAGHRDVANVVVVVREDAGREPLLAAYVVAKSGRVPDVAELRALAARSLPPYMVPSVFMTLEAMPLTANGKIDRRMLPVPVAASAPPKAEWLHPEAAPTVRRSEAPQAPLRPHSSRAEVEARLIEIWEELLPVRPILAHSDFFEAGGHSLLAARMLNRVEKSFGKKLNLATLFQGATIDKLATAIAGAADPGAVPGIIPLQPEGSKPPLLCLHGIPSMTLLSRELGTDQPFLMVHLPEGVELTPPYTVEALAEIHVRTIRRFQPHGPYYLVGWCREGILALEVAQQLQAVGETVALLTIFDAWLPQYMSRYSAAEQRHAHRLLQIERTRLNLLQIKDMGWMKAASFMPAKAWSAFNNGIQHFKWKLQYRRSLQTAAETAPLRRGQDEMLFLAVRQYQAKQYDGRVLLVRSDKYCKWKYWDPRLWWGEFLPHLQMVEIPGVHDSMLTGPSLPKIARAVADAMSRAQQIVTHAWTQGRNL